jgi:hypothetical protein
VSLRQAAIGAASLAGSSVVVGVGVAGGDETHPQRDLLQARDPYALAAFEDLHELAGLPTSSS